MELDCKGRKDQKDQVDHKAVRQRLLRPRTVIESCHVLRHLKCFSGTLRE